jgi:hypothetical protein
MISEWLDNAAKRAAGGARGSRREFVTEAAAGLASSTPDLMPLELEDSVTTPLSRRRSLKLALGAAVAMAATPVLNLAPADALTCGFHFEGLCLTDETIVSLADAVWFDELPAEPLGLIGAAIVFYEASEILDSGQPPPADGPGCTPDQTTCGCWGGFCLIPPATCDSYC